MIKQIFKGLGRLVANTAKIELTMSSVTINGKTYTGKTIEVNGNDVKIDGKPVDAADPKCKEINIVVNGGCGSIVVGVGDVTVKGPVDGEIHTDVGNIECGNVTGDVDNAMGAVKCGDVGGCVSANMGNIECGAVQGDVSASMGNIYKGR